MPGASGRDLARRFGQIRGESKILLTSGYSEALTGNVALEPGVHFLAKPFSAEQLTRVVHRVLSGHD
jgi:FixJ family two-component response regulator